MEKASPEKTMAWLKENPSLSELSDAFPELWENVRREIAEIVADGKHSGLSAYLKQSELKSGQMARNLQAHRRDNRNLDSLARQLVRHRMACLAVKQHYISEATGIEKGKVRFNLLNGFIAQKLLFSDGLERKPVSMFWFRLVWPLLWQRRLLMPLVQPEGIYCFYSRQLVSRLASLIGSRSCLEIAAGDGALAGFLSQSGVNITATDDYSWQHEVKYSGRVVKMDAREALQKYMPEVVVCSWPPAQNSFERQVFRTRSVQTYIVIGSRHHFAAGNWDDYRQQSMFELREDQALSRLVLPPELDAAVYIFSRKSSVQEG